MSTPVRINPFTFGTLNWRDAPRVVDLIRGMFVGPGKRYSVAVMYESQPDVPCPHARLSELRTGQTMDSVKLLAKGEGDLCITAHDSYGLILFSTRQESGRGWDDDYRSDYLRFDLNRGTMQHISRAPAGNLNTYLYALEPSDAEVHER